MQKRNLVFVFGIILISFVSFVSAYPFSLGDFLGGIDESTMILGVILIVSFAFINFALSRFFKDEYGNPNKSLAGIVSFVISLFIVWGINRTGFDYEGLFYAIGFSSEALYGIIPIILLILIIYMGVKFGFANLFLFSGIILIFLSFTEFIYAKTSAFIIGVILILAGLGLGSWLRKGARYAGGKGYGWWRGWGTVRNIEEARRQANLEEERRRELKLIEKMKRDRR